MSKDILGIHHITAIAGEPQQNLEFYSGLLGLRLVKWTVNFDDPTTYHLYYGDGAGHPGTIVTFFPWPKAPKGREGSGQVTAMAFAVPSGSLGYWTDYLGSRNVKFQGPIERFGEQVISLSDPDGLRVELVFSAAVDPERAYNAGTIPVEHAIHGIHSATLTEEGYQRTAAVLTEVLGFEPVGLEGTRFRYRVGTGESGGRVDVVCAPEQKSGRVAVGTVHHIAWRTPDDEQQRIWLKELAQLNFNVSPVMDRKYFHSIYFREPGGILFEIATDPPGFAIDEDAETLGTHLVLPAWLESSRAQLEAVLPPMRVPVAAR